MKEGHLPVLAEEVLTLLAPASGSLQIDATLGGGGHAERILEATDPDGRLLGLDADGAAIARVAGPPGRAVRRPAGPAPGELPGARRGRPGGRLRRGRRPPVRPRPVELPAGRRRARLRHPDRRAARHALRHRASASRPPSCSRPSTPRELAALFRRYGEEPQAGRIARAIVEARRTAPVATAEELAALVERVAPGRPRPAPDPPRHARLPGAPDRGQRRARRPRGRASPRRSTCSGRAAGSSSSATTRSRTGSSSASWTPSGRAASARRRCPICVCGRSPRLRLITPVPDRRPGRARRQPPRSERPAPGRRTDSPPSARSSRPGGPEPGPDPTTSPPWRKEDPDEQAPPVQSPPFVRPPPARAPRAHRAPARPTALDRRSAESTDGRARRLRRSSTSTSRPPAALRGRRLVAVYQGARPRPTFLPPRAVETRPSSGADRARPPARGVARAGSGSCSAGSPWPSCWPSSRSSRASGCRRPATRSTASRTSGRPLDGQRQELIADLNRLGRGPAIRKQAIDLGLDQLAEPLVVPAR